MLKIAYQLGFLLYKVSLDSEKYLLICGIFINSIQQDVNDMTSQNLSILNDFTKTPLYHFFSRFPNL